jgi:predicted nuclease of predicted toxin-antitoxin system
VKALLDEQFPPRIAELLRERGHDVVAVADRPGLLGSSDTFLLEVACSERRAVITNNVKDFRPLAAQRLARNQDHAGLILLPSSQARTRALVERLADAIETVLREHPDGLASSERWIAPLPVLPGRSGETNRGRGPAHLRNRAPGST